VDDSPTPEIVAQPTPGPWSIGPTAGIGQRGQLFVVDANGTRVADCEAPKMDGNPLKFVRSIHEDQANVRLIAAAPDLLSALEGVLAEIGAEWDDSWSSRVYEEAVYAIARARGESES
jgi:hypothetical protein